MNVHWGGIVLGVIMLAMGTTQVVTGDGGSYWGHPVPAWTCWITAPLGLYILFISLRAMLRGEGKPQKTEVTDQDISIAKAELERMYLKEHGVLPEYPDEEQGGKGSDESKAAKTQ